MIANVSCVTPPVTTAPAAPAAPVAPNPTLQSLADAATKAGNDIVGQSVADATKAVEELGFVLRVTIENGEYRMVTEDYRLDRINVAIEGNTVTGFNGVG